MRSRSSAAGIDGAREDDRRVAGVLEIDRGMVGESRHVREAFVVGSLHLKTNRETEPGRIGKVSRSSRNEPDFIQRDASTKIHLHPLGRIRLRLDAAMVAVAWTFLRAIGFCFRPKLRIDRSEL